MMYRFGFWFMLIGLTGLFQQEDRTRRLLALLPIGGVAWLIGLFAQADTFQIGLGMAFIDLLTLALGSIILRFMAASSRLTLGLSLVVVGVLGLFRTMQSTSFPPANESTNQDDLISLSEQAELLVELKNGVSPAVWLDWVAEQGLSSEVAFVPQDGERTDLDDYFVLNLPTDEVARWERWIDQIIDSGLADWAEPNEVINLELLPAKTIPGINQRLGVDDPAAKEQWGLEVLEMDKLYQYLVEQDIQPSKRTLVAILDTGVDASHEDIQDNFFSINRKYNDDPKGHGTHCAGIAGAVTNNGVGVASFARTNEFFRITSIKVLSGSGSGTQKQIIDGIIEATDRGADVLSLSLGGFSNQSRQRAYSQAVKYATDRGAIVVAAAGNSNRDAATYTPVNANGIIGVSAIDSELQRAVFSNRVNRIEMALAAPGVGIYSTKPNNNYAAHNGTSMACPHVSGVLGLMKSIQPNLTAKQAYRLLHQTGVRTKDTANTGRLIQPYRAVRTLVEESAL